MLSSVRLAHNGRRVSADSRDRGVASDPCGTGVRPSGLGDHAQIPDHAQEHRPEAGATGAHDSDAGQELGEAAKGEKTGG